LTQIVEVSSKSGGLLSVGLERASFVGLLLLLKQLADFRKGLECLTVPFLLVVIADLTPKSSCPTLTSVLGVEYPCGEEGSLEGRSK
jgi:hypothetical protein